MICTDQWEALRLGEIALAYGNYVAEKPAGLFLSLGSAVWRPLTDLGVELCDVAMWRADAEGSPLLRPLIDIVTELRAQLGRAGSSRRRR